MYALLIGYVRVILFEAGVNKILKWLEESCVRACCALFGQIQLHVRIKDIWMTCLFGFAVGFTASLHDYRCSVRYDMYVYTALYVGIGRDKKICLNPILAQSCSAWLMQHD